MESICSRSLAPPWFPVSKPTWSKEPAKKLDIIMLMIENFGQFWRIILSQAWIRLITSFSWAWPYWRSTVTIIATLFWPWWVVMRRCLKLKDTIEKHDSLSQSTANDFTKYQIIETKEKEFPREKHFLWTGGTNCACFKRMKIIFKLTGFHFHK